MPRNGRPPVERVTLPCAACGTMLTRRKSDVARNLTGRVFCDKACMDRVGGKPRRGGTNKCAHCGIDFYARPNTVSKYCSRTCHNADQRTQGVMLTCAVCGKQFHLGQAAAAERGDAPTCSRACDTLRRTKNSVGRFHNGRPVLWWHTGYLHIYEPTHPKSYRNGWFSEHRWEVEQHLGRQLATDEHVHHINGIKDDNRLENLEVMSHSAHSRLTGAELKAHRETELAELAEYRRRFGPIDNT